MGLGRTDYTDDPEEKGGGDPAFPWRTAWAGDIDITGFRRPQSYYREIVYGIRKDPFIAVLRPEKHGHRRLEMQWAWSDTVSSWTWPASAGDPIEVEVYSDAEEVELVLNGIPVGRQPAGIDAEFRARFETAYEPGELIAVAYRGGVASESTCLRSTSTAHLTATVDRSVLQPDGGDLAYITIEFVDPSGMRDTSLDHLVEVTVTGAGVLQALGSARPASDEPFHSASCTTFDGRAIAIVRPTGSGEIAVTVECEGEASTITRLLATPARH